MFSTTTEDSRHASFSGELVAKLAVIRDLLIVATPTVDTFIAVGTGIVLYQEAALKRSTALDVTPNPVLAMTYLGGTLNIINTPGDQLCVIRDLAMNLRSDPGDVIMSWR